MLSANTIGLMFLLYDTEVIKQECQQSCAAPSKSYVFFIYNRQGIKEPTLRTRSQLHNVFYCPHFTICVPFIPILLERDSGFSFFCSSASVFDLCNSANEAGPLAGSWHAH